jgi:CBS domain containing-hemolysin-like protein
MGGPDVSLSLLGLLAVAALVLANAYFVATEFALVAVRRSQLKLWLRENRRGAAAATRAVDRLDDAIAATQLGITLASIGLGWIGEPALAGLLEPTLAAAGLGSAAVHGAATVVAFALITFLHVVAGELAPKALALDRPGPVALACAGPLLVFGRVFRPALRLMNGAGNALVRRFGVSGVPSPHWIHSPEELSLLVDEAREAGAIRADTGRLLGNVFRLARTRVRDVMVPRARIFAVPTGMSLEALMDLVRDQGYTRVPVYRGNLDQTVGVLHTKDLFHLYAERRLFVLEDLLRDVADMGPDLSVLEALRRFRRVRAHLALVRDAERRVLGLVTLEDVLEEIVGEIEDEHDEPTVAATE